MWRARGGLGRSSMGPGRAPSSHRIWCFARRAPHAPPPGPVHPDPAVPLHRSRPALLARGVGGAASLAAELRMVARRTLRRAIAVPRWDMPAHTPCCTRTSILQRMGAWGGRGAQGGRRGERWPELEAARSAAEEGSAAAGPPFCSRRRRP
jgi:hypothetical protein